MKRRMSDALSRLLTPRRPRFDARDEGRLTQLLEEEEPAPDLFARIEAAIDAEERQARAPQMRERLGLTVAALLAGAAVAALILLTTAPDRQAVVARPGDGAAWVPLGAVTLHGPALRAFVRARCDGHSHFFITIEAGASPDQAPQPGEPLQDGGEKVLMDCIR